jgi:hypothetical protein
VFDPADPRPPGSQGWFDDSFVISHLVDDLSYHADLTDGQPGNEPAFMPAYEAARSRVGTQSAPV